MRRDNKTEIMSWLKCFYGWTRSHRDIEILGYTAQQGVTLFSVKLGSSFLVFRLNKKADSVKQIFIVDGDLTYIYNNSK